MTIKTATLMALCGNAATFVLHMLWNLHLLGEFNAIRLLPLRRWSGVITLAGTGTVVGLFALYRKQA